MTRINNNLASIDTYRQLSINQAQGQKSLERLSAGLKINRAGDNTAGLALSEEMRAKVKGLEPARSRSEGEDLVSGAVGASSGAKELLERMRRLAGTEASPSTGSKDSKEGLIQSAPGVTLTISREALNALNAGAGKFTAGRESLQPVNTADSEARIRSIDIRKESMEATKSNILQQASGAMLAQANMSPHNVLQLLR